MSQPNIVPKLRYSCKFPLCESKYYSPALPSCQNKRFHSFPRNETLSLKWKNACRLPAETKCDRLYVCEDHFKNSDYWCPEIRNRLTIDAFPKSLVGESEKTPSAQSLNNSFLLEYNYQISGSSTSTLEQNDKFLFLGENQKGFFDKPGILSKDLTERENEMYKTATAAKLSKLRMSLRNKNADLVSIKNLYEDGRFQFMEESLNKVTKLRNVSKTPCSRRWTMQDKAFALYIYKRSPRLYCYLKAYFQLPAIRQHIKDNFIRNSLQMWCYKASFGELTL